MENILKPFKCELCDKRFKLKTSTYKHLWSHNIIKRKKKCYICLWCDYITFDLSNFKDHNMRSQHKKRETE